MKACPYCGKQNSDDSMYCTECGKLFPQGAVCPHCKTIIGDDDAFCYNCGKSFIDKPVSTDSESLQDAGDNRDDDEIHVNEVNETEDYNYFVENETRTWHDNILYILGAIVVVGVLGACIWNYYSSSKRAERNIAFADSLEKVRKDSIVDVRKRERAKQDSIYKVQQEEHVFLELFYKSFDECRSWEEKEKYVRRNVTQKALQTLRDVYEQEDGCDDCLALWMFTFKEVWGFETLLGRKIERVSDNTFLVTTAVGATNETTYKYSSKVRIGIVKTEDSYKIDFIEKVYSEESNQNNESKTDNHSWLQGHWVYEEGNYKSHIEIYGNTIKIYSSMNPSAETASFSIDGDELTARTKGVVTVVKIDYKNHKIDWGDGRWMYKVSSISGQNSFNTPTTQNFHQRPFSNGQDIMARLYNQRFRHSSGLEIRIDGYGRIDIDGDPAGVLSVLRYYSEIALLRYGNGMYGEGNFILKIDGDKLVLQDTADGALFYQR